MRCRPRTCRRRSRCARSENGHSMRSQPFPPATQDRLPPENQSSRQSALLHAERGWPETLVLHLRPPCPRKRTRRPCSQGCSPAKRRSSAGRNRRTKDEIPDRGSSPVCCMDKQHSYLTNGSTEPPRRWSEKARSSRGSCSTIHLAVVDHRDGAREIDAVKASITAAAACQTVFNVGHEQDDGVVEAEILVRRVDQRLDRLRRVCARRTRLDRDESGREAGNCPAAREVRRDERACERQVYTTAQLHVRRVRDEERVGILRVENLRDDSRRLLRDDDFIERRVPQEHSVDDLVDEERRPSLPRLLIIGENTLARLPADPEPVGR